jgi:hypothetical protein
MFRFPESSMVKMATAGIPFEVWNPVMYKYCRITVCGVGYGVGENGLLITPDEPLMVIWAVYKTKGSQAALGVHASANSARSYDNSI